METAAVRAHEPGYQFSAFSSPDKTNVLRVGLRGYAGLVGLFAKALNISFSVKYGAGGVSMGPEITYHPVVDENRAPAFRLIETLRQGTIAVVRNTEARSTLRDESFERLFYYCWHKLRRAYQHGKGSPQDIDLRGQSLIHEVMNLTYFFVRTPRPNLPRL